MSTYPDEELPPSASDDEEGDEAASVSVQRPKSTTEPSPGMVRAEYSPAPRLDTARFEEREELGKGGAGVVIRAFDRDLLRDVAIKVLYPDFEGDEAVLGRFVEEARINGQLEHPSIVPVHEFGLDRRG